jgi:DNA modification methylase
MGSGTTAIGALKFKRNWLGIELNPEYIEIAEKRIKKYINEHRVSLGV